MIPRLCLVLSLLLLLSTGCSTGDRPTTGEERLESPAGPQTGQPRLFRSPDGTVWLSWVAALQDGRHALRYATLTDTAWTAPVTVATGADWFVNWADLPAVRPLPDGRIAAHYLESNGSSSLAYGIRIAQSDGQGGWNEVVTPHEDRSPTEHGFVSIVPWSERRLLTVWLDGRAMSGTGHGTGDMTLRSAVLTASGAVERRDMLDARTCECCATSAVRVGNDVVVAYRDRSENEVRDISLVRFDGTSWTDPKRLHADGWRIEGCPVNGPALAADEQRVGVTWFTAAGGRPRVQVSTSADGGHTFAEPIVVAEDRAKGRVDVVVVDDQAIVSWLETTDEGGRIRVRAVRSDRSLGESLTVASLPSADRGIGFPKMVQSRKHMYVAWVESTGNSSDSRVQVTRLPLRRVL